MNIIISLLISSLAVFISSYLLPGIHLKDFPTAIIVAITLGLINMFVKPILIVFTLPINILTLGLFTFVINALLILLVTALVPGFKVDNFGWALLFSLVLSVVNSLLNGLVK